jgi:hypothetical protein
VIVIAGGEGLVGSVLQSALRGKLALRGKSVLDSLILRPVYVDMRLSRPNTFFVNVSDSIRIYSQPLLPR